MSEEEIKNHMIPDEIKYICMECEDNIHKQEKGCAWRSLGNEYCDYVLNATKLYLDKDKEIERLREELEKEKYLVDKYTRQLTDEYKNTEYQCKEKERLNKIINELEEYIKWQRKCSLSLNNGFTVSRLDVVLNKLQELKGDDKK